MNKQSLKDKAKSITSASLPIMDNRDKGDSADLIGVIVTITDFDFLTGDNGDYVVFTIKEDADKFYFGGKVLTDSMKEFKAEGYYDTIKEEGLPMVMLTKKNKKGNRSYTAVQFYPEGYDKE